MALELLLVKVQGSHSHSHSQHWRDISSGDRHKCLFAAADDVSRVHVVIAFQYIAVSFISGLDCFP